MRISRIPLVLVSISPLISLFRAWQAMDARVKGLMSDVDAQRQLLTNVAIAGSVYVVLMVVCLAHLIRNPRVGTVGKIIWGGVLVVLPFLALPVYLLLHFRPAFGR